jgi:phosphatidate cytidylyltransferase
MIQRILTAAVGIPLVLAAVLWLPERWFFLFLLVLVEVAALEYVGLFRSRLGGAGLGALPLLVPLVALLLRPDLLVGQEVAADWRLLLCAGIVMTVGLGSLALAGRATVEVSAASLGALAFGVLYLVVPLLSLLQLRDFGARYFLLLLVVVWACDSAAYIFGIRYGRHKMSPRISPAKSREGLAAGVAAAALLIAAWWFVLGRDSEPAGAGAGLVGWMALALATALATVVGDLTESLLKRSQAVKDSGHLLPGHGGILDRIDGLIFAAPIWTLGVGLLQ